MINNLSSLKSAAKLMCGAFLAFSLSIGAVFASELRLASGVPPLHPAHDPLYTEFKELLVEQSSGELSGSLLGTEVVSLRNMRASILSGLVEVGLFLPAYFPADLPNFNLVGDLSLLGADAQATTGAVTEYMMTCGDCLAEFEKLQTVYTTSHANPYRLLTTTPVETLGDIRGKRIRVATPQHARWVESMGGKAVSLATGEVFEAISQGVVDGTVASISDLISFNLGDVITHITLLDLGTFHSTSNHTVKRSVWESLSAEDRRSLLEASFKSSILTTYRWLEMTEKGMQIAHEKGIQVLYPEQELIEATAGFVENDVEGAAASAEKRFGVSDGANKISRFKALVKKWEGLLEGKDDVDSIMVVYESEILSKIDLANYGQ